MYSYKLLQLAVATAVLRYLKPTQPVRGILMCIFFFFTEKMCFIILTNRDCLNSDLNNCRINGITVLNNIQVVFIGVIFIFTKYSCSTIAST